MEPLVPWRRTAQLVCRETAWQMELKGDVTRQRRLEAIDKLLSVLTLIVGSVFGLQALGLDGESGCELGWWILGRCCSMMGATVCWPTKVAKTRQFSDLVSATRNPSYLWCPLLQPLGVLPTRRCAFAASLQSTQCWPLAAWVAWRWVWPAARSWRTSLRDSSSSHPTHLRWVL